MSMQLAQEGVMPSSATGKSSEGDALGATLRLGGYTAIGGAVTMIIGAILWGTSGTDLWAALDTGDMAGYLTAVGALKPQLIANLTFWIIGVLILGVAGQTLATISAPLSTLAKAGQTCYAIGVPLVVVAYIAMLVLIVQIAPDTSATSVALAKVIGWIGARADDLATALILGFGPLFFSLAGRDAWTPGWLVLWGYLCGGVGLFSLITLYLGVPTLSSLAFIIIPIGLIWLIATGVVLLRRVESR